MSGLYNTARWQRRRAQQLKDHPLCKLCSDMRARVTEATVADHVIPHRGSEHLFWYGELQSLCAECHSGWKQEMETTGHISGCDLNGIPLDPSHPWRIELNNTSGGPK